MPTLYAYYLSKRRFTCKSSLLSICSKLGLKDKEFTCTKLVAILDDMMIG